MSMKPSHKVLSATLVSCLCILLITGYGWFQYYVTVAHPKGYHATYFAIVWVPAASLSLALLLISLRNLWTRIIGIILAIPALPLWALALMLTFADFKIH